MNDLITLAPDLFVYPGAINVGILRQGERAWLIDCGDGDVLPALSALGIRQVEAVLFTHYHRDQASGFGQLPGSPLVRAIVPTGERDYFAQVERFWQDPAFRWHLYNFQPSDLLLAESIPVDATGAENTTFAFGPWTVRVLATPGHTPGSVSYLVERAGQRFAFVGDAIYGPGQLWDVYSLQRGGTFGERTIRDYHGFLGARTALAQSLRKLREAGAQALIPSHGVMMTDPVSAIDALVANLDRAYANYAGISALRYYFPEMFADYVGQPEAMPMRPGMAIPDFVRHVGTSWVIVADDGAALLMDCGSHKVLDELRHWQASGEIRQVDAFWISHYHDDHVDFVEDLQREFPCPTYADAQVAAIVRRPRAYRLPCISPAVARIDQVTTHGTSWRWHEFRLTAYHFPGQTYYHGALLVEGYGQRLFFIGDSFTMAGIDDYCAGNRNFLGAGRGFDACLALVEDLQPNLLFNCHVPVAFAFTADEIRFMRRNLAEREAIFATLLPWEDPNFGLDEHWLRAEPFEQDARPGEVVSLDVVVTNHASAPRLASGQPIVPRGWETRPVVRAVVPRRTERALSFRIPVPAEAKPGLRVIPIAVELAGRKLGQFRAAMLWIR
jgi:glyoxylase-like metal-dependent hydrolase (beta-lactamase superfamily II)